MILMILFAVNTRRPEDPGQYIVYCQLFLLKCLIKLDELTCFMHFYTINMKTAVFVHVSGMKIKIMVLMIYLGYITG